MDNAFKGAVNFLMFSYFGITSDDDKDTIIRAAIDVAYNDATGQGAFNTLFPKEDSNAKENKYNIDKAKGRARGELKKFVEDEIINKELNKNWHSDICCKISDCFSNEKIVLSEEKQKYRYGNAFSYGNAQKWVNMTLKNLYIIGTLLCEIGVDNTKNHKSEDDWKQFRNNSFQFHIPIDNYILQSVYHSKKGQETRPELNENNTHKIENRTYMITQESKNETYKIKTEDRKYSWSQIPTYEFYQDIHNIIHDLYDKSESPLVWENKEWLSIAKARRKAKKN